MPTIQQQNGVKSVKGLPERWGRRAYRELAEALKDGATSDRYLRLCALLDSVTNAPLPLDATDAHICVLAERYARDCSSVVAVESAEWWPLPNLPGDGVGPREYARRAEGLSRRDRMANICAVRGIQAPACLQDDEAVARCVDPSWWRRNLRKVHGRAFEAAAIRLGFVSSRAGAYASDETVARRRAQIERNKATLASVLVENENGFRADLGELANKTTANKRIRRGELMLRLAGCEDVAIEAGHVGIFVTLTAPSKFHAVLEKSGAVNPKYQDATPRDVQTYLQKTWARIRTAYGKKGIRPYGFRIAEPHHDGCVHWHMLLFMPGFQVRRFQRIVRHYGLAVDPTEPGAQERRVTFERIDSAKGSAASYIAKYISKNIDDDTDDAHDETIGADGQPVKIVIDKAKRASQRVDAWAGVWGVRQFQPIGQPPVTVWRELRRIQEEAIQDAPEHVRAAWDAAQRIEKNETDAEGEVQAVELVKAASYGAYIRAQGGVCLGRGYRIGLAEEQGAIAGRYGPRLGFRPVGVADRVYGAVFASVRYTWTRVEAVDVAVRRSWSTVNNCTERASATAPHWWGEAVAEPVADFDDVWFSDEGNLKILLTVDEIMTLPEVMEGAREQRANTIWTNLPGTERMITKLKEKGRAHG